MWFLLTLLALSMQVSRRSAEKVATGNISSLALSWLQQAVALPFILITLLFARFYFPSELSHRFWLYITVYIVLGAVDVYCYFKALSLADVSYVAPLLTLTAVGNIMGAYFVLHQIPSILGVLGAVFIILGAGIFYYVKRKDLQNSGNNKLAALFILLLVLVRAYASNIELFMTRESNPATFNFYTSALTVPLVLLVSLLVVKTSRGSKYDNYWHDVGFGIKRHKGLLVFIGLTYTVAILSTYSAKLIAPNAGYVGAIKSASVLPMVLIGVLFFKEKIKGSQWGGLAFIACGLALLALN